MRLNFRFLITGFLNTNKGNLIIGINENKEGKSIEYSGIDHEYSIVKDQNADGAIKE